MKRSGIYQITNNINQRIYIGSAVNIKKRWYQHSSDLRLNRHYSLYLQRSYNKYGAKSFSYSILCLCPKEDLIKMEQFFIDTLKPEYNISKTAGSCLGLKASEETKRKISANSASRGLFGKYNPTSKTVYQYDENGKFLKEWGSRMDIERDLGISSGNIGKSIYNRWFYYNSFWSYQYYGEIYKDIPKRHENWKKCRKAVLQYTADGKLIKEFVSIKEANASFGKRASHITHCLKGRIKTCYGYIWKYKENVC
jgi:group I intron endonuclease